MLSGYMTGPGVCGYMHRRQVNTRKHKTKLAYIGRAPFKRRPRSPASSLVDFSRRSQQPRAAAKFPWAHRFPPTATSTSSANRYQNDEKRNLKEFGDLKDTIKGTSSPKNVQTISFEGIHLKEFEGIWSFFLCMLRV